MIRDRRFNIYLGLSSVYFLIVFLVQIFSNDLSTGVEIRFTDKLFSYQFCVMFLLGTVIIDQHYSAINYHRYKNRKAIIVSQVSRHLIFSFVFAFILFAMASIVLIVFNGNEYLNSLKVFTDKYFRFVLGFFLAGIISLNFRYSNFKRISNIPYIASYLVVLTELMLFENIKKSFDFDIYLMFSWVFSDYILLSYGILILCSVILTVVLYKRIDKVDLSL